LEIPVIAIAIHMKSVIYEVVVEIVASEHISGLKTIPYVELEDSLRKGAMSLNLCR